LLEIPLPYTEIKMLCVGHMYRTWLVTFYEKIEALGDVKFFCMVIQI